MPSIRRSLAPSLGAALLVGALATPASGARLDQPPRVYTFKLDDPSATNLTLLEGLHGSALEHPARKLRSISGTFGRWSARPWWTLAWSPVTMGGSRVGPSEAKPFAPPPIPPVEPPALDLTPELPAWRSRVDPAPAGWVPFFTTGGTTFTSGLPPGIPLGAAPKLASNGFDALWSLPPTKPLPDWRCRRRPVRFVRYGAESDAFLLVKCDGNIAQEAIDRLTLMARVPDAPRPGELLPDEPDPEAVVRGEWLPGVRLVHPRLAWLLQRIADAFPWRTIYIYSGYRPGAVVTTKAGTHHSMHSEARAMDINVMGIPNAELFRFCRTLEDIGCGFYPNSKFVHVDVRRPGTGHAFWIDASGPGEPARYVDSWPGVVDGGALSWEPGKRDSSCVLR